MSHIPALKGGRDFQVIYPGAAQTVSVSGVSAQSTAFAEDTDVIRVIATTDCHLAFGLNPTATTGDLFLVANAVEYFGVYSGEKVAAIQSSAGGTLYITEAE